VAHDDIKSHLQQEACFLSNPVVICAEGTSKFHGCVLATNIMKGVRVMNARYMRHQTPGFEFKQ